ncbi:histone-like nucleoid-structuring protein Lsr2 [Rhodococcus sp. NPDC003318]|uniref:Lsr2 dimerization domain-containing protein n=1 Tax=Rhodococcus sp. NPDC003318 TaxID=3364503 RepID=UPI0036ACE15C
MDGKEVTLTIVDNVDSVSEADEIVVFSLDCGTDYEIDLTAGTAARVRDDLAVWVAHARRTSGRGSAAKSKPASSAARTPFTVTPARGRCSCVCGGARYRAERSA